MKKTAAKKGNPELIEALNAIEKEKDISKEILLEAIENSLVAACKNEYGKADNIRVNLDRETGEFHVYQDKVVVEEVEDAMLEMSQTEAEVKYPGTGLGETVSIEVTPKNFGRIAAQKAKQVVVQKIREEERKVLFEQYYEKEHDIVTGMVQRYNNGNYNVNIGKIDAVLTKQEQVPSEHFEAHDRIKLYVTEVKDTPRGPRIVISRTHPELVKRLFESEVAEIQSGVVEIKNVSREAGSRSKIAVYSNNPDVDAVGACVGMNGARVNAVVDELYGEKIDIVEWNEDPAIFIEHALSPSKVVSVTVDPSEKSAEVIVPDYQLSLAIGKEGQNARLAARLTGFKIDIKSETQARESGDFMDYENDYEEDDYDDDYDYSDDELAENERLAEEEQADAENKYVFTCKNTGRICLFTSTGQMHTIKVLDLPYGKFRDKGTPIDNVSNFSQKNEEIIYITSQKELNLCRVIFATAQSMLKVVDGGEFDVTKRTVAATKLAEGDSVVSVAALTDQRNIVLQTKAGFFLRFAVDEIPEKKKGAIGVRGMKLGDGDQVENVYYTKNAVETTIEYKGKELVLNNLKLGKRDSKGTKVRV